MEALKKIAEKINLLIQRLMGKEKTAGMMRSGSAKEIYMLSIPKANRAMNLNQYAGEINEAIYKVGGMELPVGSFSMEGNHITIEDPVEITPEGEMFMNGKPMKISPQLQEEIAFQIQKNGKPGIINLNNHGEVMKNRAQEYRDSTYDPVARERTEKISERYQEQPVRQKNPELNKEEDIIFE